MADQGQPAGVNSAMLQSMRAHLKDSDSDSGGSGGASGGGHVNHGGGAEVRSGGSIPGIFDVEGWTSGLYDGGEGGMGQIISCRPLQFMEHGGLFSNLGETNLNSLLGKASGCFRPYVFNNATRGPFGLMQKGVLQNMDGMSNKLSLQNLSPHEQINAPKEGFGLGVSAQGQQH